ncbi:PHP domain-containing protein [Candidatus Calescamantes bacterium]|nr:PHP domain-containing protein [Candidatus Calescamantes bacterium]
MSYYREILANNPTDKEILNKLLGMLNSYEPREALVAALVLVEQRFISENERLDAVRVIKKYYQTFLNKPLRLKGMVDLHIHSFYSDAVATPSEIVVGAWLEGMEAVSLVNHNTFNGILEAMKAGEILGIKVVPGIEIDVKEKSLGIENMHIVIYFNFQNSKEFQEWLRKIENDPVKKEIDELYTTFVENGKRMVEAFNKKGFRAADGSGEELSLDEKDVISSSGEMIVRARLSEALLKKYGFEKLGADRVKDIMKKYFTEELGTYFGRRSLPLDGIAKFVVREGGILIIPHPTEITDKYGVPMLEKLLNKYAIVEIDGKKYLGIRGVEVYSYKTYRADRIKEFLNLVEELNKNHSIYRLDPLIVTVGSDGHFHFRDFAFQRIPDIQPGGFKVLEDLFKIFKQTAVRLSK